MKIPEPTKAEATALFRLGVVGDLLARELSPGELRAELLARAAERYRPPGAKATRQFHWKTLQCWYYAAKHGGHKALAPASRKLGFALALTPQQRDLLLQIRTEHPSAPSNLILDTAVRQGVVQTGQVSISTLRRMFAEAGVTRTVANRAQRRDRRRWEAARVGAVWHADVCHVWVREPDGTPRKVYVQGILDDHSRFVVALEARDTEREVDFLAVLCGALLRYPPPDVVYVDNGACYRGEILALVCAKLGIKLVHAQPYDPEARGKMERFWRRLRERCTDYLAGKSTLQDVNTALLAFLDAEYHARPHSSLMGETPAKRFHNGLQALPRPWTPRELATVLEVSMKRRVAGDATFGVDGRTFEVRGRHLAHKTIEVVVDPFTGVVLRASYQDKPVVVGVCDPALNRGRRRAKPEAAPTSTVPFDPIAALLARARKQEE
jgi:transposase InsO family protein